MKRMILALVAAAALFAPASALAGNIVLKVEHSSHLAAIAQSKHVMLVHTTARLSVGERVAMSSRRLANGTFSATKVRVLGHAKDVAFRGFVLSRSKAAHRLTLSAGGAPVTVHADDTAQPGSEVEVDADVEDNGQLNATQVTVVAPSAPGGSIEGHVFALGTGTITIVSEHQLLVLKVPAGIDLSKLAIGDEVFAQFTQGSDGSLTLTSIGSDESAAAADDDNNDQGDDNNGGHDGGGSGDGGGGSDH
jgi:Domain of unknown function (DUF5666)